MRRTITLTALIALAAAMSVMGPAAAHHKNTASPNHKVACGYTPETSAGPDTHVTGYDANYAFVYDTSDDDPLNLFGNNNNGWGTVNELSVSTVGEDGTHSSPTCPDLLYRLVLFSSSPSKGGQEVGRWELRGNGTTTLEFFPGDKSFTFYDESSPFEACHYVEVVDPTTGTLYDRSPDEGCATVPPEGQGATSYR